MGALEDAHVLVVIAEHGRRSREQLEILGTERRRLVGEHERLVGVPPRPPCVRPASSLELVGSSRVLGGLHGSTVGRDALRKRALSGA
jgi:hypothetical protein